MKQPFLSIVIPIFNEEKRIARTIAKIVQYLSRQSFRYELILVNDASHDQSQSVIEKTVRQCSALLQNGKVTCLNSLVNKGKGFSVKRGILIAEGRYVLFTDADLSAPIEEIEKLMGYMQKGYNVAIGSRALKGSEIIVRQNWMRHLMGRCFNIFVRKMTGLKIYDTQCGFKCFDQQAVQSVIKDLKVHDFAFDVELLVSAKKRGLKIVEVPVRWINSPESKVHIVRDSIGMFFSLMRIKRLHSV